MSANCYAVLVGVNGPPTFPVLRFAEKDCDDLLAALCDPGFGLFPRENVQVLLGKEAITSHLKRALRTQLVTNREGADLVLMYFSGHGFVCEIGGRRRTYLASYDSDIAALMQYPHEGLDMEFLHDQVFTETRAKAVLVILDCCHSGAFVPESLRDKEGLVRAGSGRRSQTARSEFLSRRLVSGIGRIALVSCSADAVSRESPEYRNGLFTHFVVRGLAGEAIEHLTGDVTLDSLGGYLRNRLPKEVEHVRYGQESSRLILARHRAGRAFELQIPLVTPRLKPTPLSHQLDPITTFIAELLDRLNRHLPALSNLGEKAALEAIRETSRAERVLLVVSDPEQHSLRVLAESSSRPERAQDQREVLNAVSACLSDHNFFKRSGHGAIVSDVESGSRSLSIVIPMGGSQVLEQIVVCGIDRSSTLLTDTFGMIVSATLAAVRKVQPNREYSVEPILLDELKRTYGFLPVSMYQRRLELFRDNLKDVQVFFQPVFFLDPRRPDIDSWEALARDSRTGRLPEELFDAAELWGRRFMRELDATLLEKTLSTYRELRAESVGSERRELSVNVYPQSLLSLQYKAKLSEVIRAGLITPERLVLELSDKVPIPRVGPEAGDDAQLERFKAVLETYVKELRVTFSIDDFGERHSSVSRLARLNPMHVKIDRDVLLHDFGPTVIRFVLELTQTRRLHPVKCVVEGFDGASRLRLGTLYDLGVRYIQGFSLEEPSPRLRLVDDEKRGLIQGLLKEQG